MKILENSAIVVLPNDIDGSRRNEHVLREAERVRTSSSANAGKTRRVYIAFIIPFNPFQNTLFVFQISLSFLAPPIEMHTDFDGRKFKGNRSYILIQLRFNNTNGTTNLMK